MDELIMAPAASSSDRTVFFLAAGWEQFTLDGQFNIIPPCMTLARLSGYPAPDLEGVPFVNLFDPPDQEKLTAPLARLAGAKRQPITTMVLPLPQAGPVEIMLHPAPEAGQQYIGFIRPLPEAIINFLPGRGAEMTELEQYILELETTLERVQEADRLKSKLLEDVSHELRNPLTFIKAYAALLLEGDLGEINDKAKTKLEIISQKTALIFNLVEDIVSLQKMESGTLRLKPIPPAELINQAVLNASLNAAEYGIELVTDCPAALPPVWGDMERLDQVFDNLLSNAIKFSPPGGEIHLKAELDGQQVKFSVQDYGIGIPDDKLEKIFERFYRVNETDVSPRRGTGLGLAIAKEIIEAHQGRLTVESVLAQGTVFFFSLPITPLQKPSVE